MVFEPEGIAVVVQLATPVAVLTGIADGQSGMEPPFTVKVTDPDSLTALVKGVTVAVKVTGFVTMDGSSELVRVRLDDA